MKYFLNFFTFSYLRKNYYINIFLLLFLILALIIILIPINPSMPYQGLDGSWMHAINVALVNKMQIGKDIIFTFGPLASIYTKTYHPLTDSLMLFGSSYLAFCYFLLITEVFFEKNKKVIILFIAFIFLYRYYFDEFLYYYIILYALYSIKVVEGNKNNYTKPINLFCFLIINSAIGIFLLIKGTFLIFPIVFILTFFYFIINKLYRLALLSLFSVLFCILFIWAFTNQAISNLYLYFLNLVPIIEGYSDAMGVNNHKFELLIPIYFIFAVIILYSVINKKSHNKNTKIYLIFCLLFFLFFYFSLLFC